MPILHAVISLFLVDRFQRNLMRIFIWLCGKGFQRQRSKVQVVTRPVNYVGRGIHFDSVVSWRICSNDSKNDGYSLYGTSTLITFVLLGFQTNCFIDRMLAADIQHVVMLSGLSAKSEVGERYTQVWAPDNGRVPFP